MTWQIVVRKGAEIEIAEAATRYEQQRPTLGRQFLESVQQGIRDIAERPGAWPFWGPRRAHRKYVLSRFPFLIFYKMAGETIHILAVAHAKRKPGYWARRER